MSFMDTSSGPSSSYSARQGRGWGANRGGQGRGRGYGYSGQDGAGFGGYDQENYHSQGRGGRGYVPQNSGYAPQNTGYAPQSSNGWGDYRGRRGSYRGRAPNVWGSSSRGTARLPGRGRGRGRAEFPDPEDVKFIKILRGHSGGVCAMAVNEAAGQLFTGSKDQTVRMWDIQKGGELMRTVQVGGEVDSMLLESGMLFVGLHAPGSKEVIQSLPGSIKVYNLQAGSEHTLSGHLGPVYAIAAGMNMLFSGGHDQSIRVWQFNQTTSVFEAAAVLTAAQGGHVIGVKAFQIITKFLFSADFQGCIKVWDMEGGQCVQTIASAHDGVIMSLLAWQGFLLSGSIDGTIRIWQLLENPAPGAVIEPTPSYSHPPTNNPGPSNPEAEGMFGKILALNGTTDREGNPILLASCSPNRVVRLWQLPDFSDRGHLNAIQATSLACAQGYIFAGDFEFGNVKMWNWK